MTAWFPDAVYLTFGASISLLALVVSAFLGAYVFGLNPRGPANRSFVLVMFAFVVWDLGELVLRSASPGTSPAILFLWARVMWLGVSLVPATLYHLVLSYPRR